MERSYVPFNSLVTEGNCLTMFPSIASEWHPTKNGDLIPSNISSESYREFWWVCSECSNEWEEAVASRTIGEKGCPLCSRRSVSYM
jgi:hypothetical protein